MKVIFTNQAGDASVLQAGDAPDPQITHSTDVLVQIKAAGVNPVDTKLRSRGTYYPGRYPAVLGCDGAGIVAAVGPAVKRFKEGDEVYFCHGGIGGEQGSYAEYKLVTEDCLAHKPKSLSFVQAAAAPLVIITAWEALFDRCKLQAEDEALIHAGAGGVGHVAIQLAKHRGARVCTTVSSPAKAQLVKELGADEAINYRERDFVEAVVNWSQHGGVRVAFDTVGGATFAQTFGAVQFYGDLVTLLQPGPDVDWKVARNRNLRISYELMLSPMFYGLKKEQHNQRLILEQAAALFDSGKLRIHVSKTLPLSEVAHAHQLIEAGGVSGKIVLDLSL